MSADENDLRYGRFSSMIWISIFKKIRVNWKFDCDLQELATFLEKHGTSGRQTLENRSKSRVSKRSQAHWRRLLRLYDAWRFGFISHPQLDKIALLESNELPLSMTRIDPAIKEDHEVDGIRERVSAN